jgi:hypothetical protein
MCVFITAVPITKLFAAFRELKKQGIHSDHPKGIIEENFMRQPKKTGCRITSQSFQGILLQATYTRCAAACL